MKIKNNIRISFKNVLLSLKNLSHRITQTRFRLQGDQPLTHRLHTLLFLGAMLTMTFEPAQAMVSHIEYSGSFESILDANGDVGGSFSPGKGVNMGDTFSGIFELDFDVATSETVLLPDATLFDFGFGLVFPSFTLNSTDIPLQPKNGFNIANNIDGTVFPEAQTYFAGSFREAGFDPIPNPLDIMMLFTDVAGGDPSTGNLEEIIFLTFDPTGLALTNGTLSDPLVLLDNAFLIYLESTNGNIQAAGFGTIDSVMVSSIPLPPAFLLFGAGLVSLVGFGRLRS